MNDYNEILYQVEKAVDQHPKLVRRGEAKLEMTRSGSGRFKVSVEARYRGSRKKPAPIHGRGDTAEDAALELVEMLDSWAGALK